MTVAGLTVRGNAGRARSQGAEFTGQLIPLDSLTIKIAAAYGDGELRDNTPALQAFAGDHLPMNPEWSGSLSADYSMQLSRDWRCSLGGTIRYVGERNSSFPGSASRPNVVLDTYSIADLWFDIEKGPLTASLFVRNLSDERAQLSAFSLYGLNEVAIARPRTIGLNLGFRY